ncbi:MAG TPA: NAD-dependent epimerase/dehydratase family protein [Stellaceae bacterium]|jgi:dolichol-phosphate mannosyltransferase|nr:NAD-dependent epimerase/dehydratase family protein [Stellaceae bacterium]
MTDPDFRRKVESLQGPVLVLGASGFVGANLLRQLLRYRTDVFGTCSPTAAWRLEGLPSAHVIPGDLLIEQNIEKLLDTVRPRTVFDCVAYGAYSFENDVGLIYRTNIDLTARLIEQLGRRKLHRYVHAGSSSEYGDDAAGPVEDSALRPNSHYSVSKGAAAGLLQYAGRKLGFPGVNLRLYSIYGPYEDAARLVPTAILKGLRGEHTSYVDPEISRDFLYVDDACEAFVEAALNLREDRYGESYNIGSGSMTTIGMFAQLCQELFVLPGEPHFTMPSRTWDVPHWFSNPAKAETELGWRARTPLRDGLQAMAEWCRSLDDIGRYEKSSKKFGPDEIRSVSAVIACYRDAQAIPIMYSRLKATFEKLNVAHEIIFVNDNSPDNSEEVIRGLSVRDHNVIGVSHSRNFGSQSAFRSGMEVATKNACVLLDGDLQDPPELIEQFMAKWREGYDVVYGHRVEREAPWYMELAYKTFYRLFKAFSYVAVPRDAGDFSLMDRRVVRCLLSFPERDLFIRGVRAFVGFRQTGIDYVRPERMFGVSTNNFLGNIGWAKKGILSFTNMPLNVLSAAGAALFVLSLLLGLVYVASRLLFPQAAPRGFTSLVLIVIFFGSLNLLAASLIGEYIAKIFEEVKHRPHFIRRSFVRDGEVREASEASHVSFLQNR